MAPARLLMLATCCAAALSAVPPAAADEAAAGSDRAPPAPVYRTREFLDAQRRATTPVTGIDGEEAGRILKNQRDSIGKGGSGAPLPDPSSGSGSDQQLTTK